MRFHEAMTLSWVSEASICPVANVSGLRWPRAFARQAPLLLLDEPTSALDAATEPYLVRTTGRATLTAPRPSWFGHRLATVRRADRIVVLDSGRVVESGSHATLLQAGGSYAELWRRQAPVTTKTGVSR